MKASEVVAAARRRNPAPKILFLDIETFPNLAYTWGKWEQNVIRFTQEGCVATFAAKWLGRGRVFAKALPDYPNYTPKSYDDKALAVEMWKLLDEADVVVAHNGRDFDVRVIQGRFILHRLPPPSPFKVVDTKLMAKAVARYNSNALDDLGNLLFKQRKIKTDFDLWEGCIAGKPAAWKKMVAYNKKDVLLLEKLYLFLRPWMYSHPNVGNYTDEPECCPKCGSKKLRRKGLAHTSTMVYQRYQCDRCGGWTRSVRAERRDFRPMVSSR